MTTADMAPTPLDRAHRAIAAVEGIAHRLDDPDYRLQAAATGVQLGRIQELYLAQAQACALISIAESLEAIRDILKP